MVANNLTTIARPYAKAIFALAKNSNSYQEWSNILQFLSIVIKDDRVQKFINNKTIIKKDKTKFFCDLCDNDNNNGNNKLSKNLIKILADNDRLGLLPEITRIFEKLIQIANNIIIVNIATAYNINEKELNKITEILAKRFKSSISLSCQIDNSLIGGMVIHIGDSMVIDVSIKGRLQELYKNLV